MAYNPPPLDRDKVGKFLKLEKERIAFRDKQWLPVSRIGKQDLSRLELVQDMIGHLASGEFDLEKPAKPQAPIVEVP